MIGMQIPQQLRDHLAHQDGLLTRRQVLAAGVSPAALRWQLSHGWTAVLPGVLAAFTGSLTSRQRLIAGQLLAGDEAVMSGLTAASWHGVLAAAGTPLVWLQVPGRLRARRHGFVVVRRTSRPDPGAWDRGPLRIASPPRAVLDAARDARSAAQARAIVIEAVQRGITRCADLRHELETGAIRGSRIARVAVQEAEAGAWSVPEADLLGLLEHSTRLPTVMANPRLTTPQGQRLPTPDAWVDDVCLAIQVHSRTFHARDGDWDATVMTDGLLVEQGAAVLGVTPARIEADPAEVLARIEHAYLSLRGRPRPQILAQPRGHGLLLPKRAHVPASAPARAAVPQAARRRAG